MAIIKVRIKDSPDTIKYISDSSFDPNTMEKIEMSKININNMKNPPQVVSYIHENYDRGSLIHNGKLDEGSTANLLDIGLTKAKERAKTRIKRYGRFSRSNKIHLGKRKKRRLN